MSFSRVSFDFSKCHHLIFFLLLLFVVIVFVYIYVYNMKKNAGLLKDEKKASFLEFLNVKISPPNCIHNPMSC